IADALKTLGTEVDRHTIEVTEPIKTLGTFDVGVKLHSGVTASIKVWVVAE
ncbi:MAG: hypothetical protein RL199_1452, partial [Pseudomonadota bacterium]